MPVEVTFEFARPQHYLSLHTYNCTTEPYHEFLKTMKTIIGRIFITKVLTHQPHQRTVIFINNYRKHNQSGLQNTRSQLFDETMRKNLKQLQTAHYYLGTMKYRPIHYFLDPIHVSAFLAYRTLLNHLKRYTTLYQSGYITTMTIPSRIHAQTICDSPVWRRYTRNEPYRTQRIPGYPTTLRPLHHLSATNRNRIENSPTPYIPNVIIFPDTN